MTWKEWLGYNLYKKLWFWAGRPFTYIIRDIRQKYPTPWMLAIMVVSTIVGHYFWGWMLLMVFVGLLIGILWGHLWWGTKYIPNQRGE